MAHRGGAGGAEESGRGFLAPAYCRPPPQNLPATPPTTADTSPKPISPPKMRATHVTDPATRTGAPRPGPSAQTIYLKDLHTFSSNEARRSAFLPALMACISSGHFA